LGVTALLLAALVLALSCALILHPLVTYRLSLDWLAPKQPALVLADRDAPRPSLAICLCAYNEERVIVAKAENLLAMAAAYGPASVHVYVDCPSDATLDLLRPYADRLDLVVGAERRGKTYGMNVLTARADSDLILFTDANVEAGDDAAIELARPFADPSVGLASARLVYSNRKETATASLGALYWQLEEGIKSSESATIGLVGCDGAMFMLRRALHVAPPPHLIDDLYISLKVLISGYRLITVDAVRVAERSATLAVEESRRKRRIACQAFNVHRALWGELSGLPGWRLYGYISHRLLKWMVPFLVAGALCGAVAMLFALVPLGWALGVLGAGAGLPGLGLVVPVPLVSTIASALLSIYGVGLGVVESMLSGKTYTVWEPAGSVRAK